MKIKATYSCGHDATKTFDLRNSFARGTAQKWPARAETLCCPKCNRTRQIAAINSLDADAVRQILIGLISAGQGEAVRAVEDAANPAAWGRVQLTRKQFA